MECYCLTRNEYKDFINHLIFQKNLEHDDLLYYIERAKDYFDCNIIGSNFYLSIILEQLMRSNELDDNIIANVYKLQESLFFSIEEHGYAFVNSLLENNIPIAYNNYRKLLNSAVEQKDEEKVTQLKSNFGEPFEKDLNRIIGCYYEG